MFQQRIWKHLFPALVFGVLALAGCGDDDDTGTSPIDTTRPTVKAVSPAAGSLDVAVTTTLKVTFSEPIDLDSVTAESFRLFLAVEPAIPVPAKAAEGADEFTFAPAEPLFFSTLYRAEADSGLTDLAGNSLGADYIWTFTTENEPPPPVEFPLALGNGWLYESESSATVWTASGVSTSSFEGLRVLYLESPATWEGRDCWLTRSYSLDQTITTNSALETDYFYLAQDYLGLYRARPGSDSGQWKNVALFLELEFDDSAFLIAGGPAHSDGSTLSAHSVTVPAGDFETVLIEHDYSYTGNYASEDIFETRREYFADGTGLVAATWDYSFDDNDPSGIDIVTEGYASLLEPMNGPALPYLAAEFEPNDAPGHALAQSLTTNSIISGYIHIDDSGLEVLDENIQCFYPECVQANIDGDPILQDWYRLVVTVDGQYRLDLVYDYYDYDNDTWNDLDFYFFEELGEGLLGYIAGATAPENNPDWMILLNLTAGTYYVAVQAWTTPSDPAGYTLGIRPQAVPVILPKDGRDPGAPRALTSKGKRAAR